MARAKRRRSGRVSGSARQGAQDKQKKFLKYGLGGAAVAAIVVVMACCGFQQWQRRCGDQRA